MPESLRQGAGSKASSVYSQPDEATSQPSGSRFAEDLPESTSAAPAQSRPEYPEVSNASHTAVKDAPLADPPAVHINSQAQSGTSDSAAEAFKQTHNDTDGPTSAITPGVEERQEPYANVEPGSLHNQLSVDNTPAGTRDSGIAANSRPTSGLNSDGGSTIDTQFLNTGVPSGASTELPAVGPEDKLIRRMSDEKSLAETIPMPTHYLDYIKGPVPGGWNDPANHVSQQEASSARQSVAPVQSEQQAPLPSTDNHQHTPSLFAVGSQPSEAVSPPQSRIPVPVFAQQTSASDDQLAANPRPTGLVTPGVERSVEDRERAEAEAESRTPRAEQRQSYLGVQQNEPAQAETPVSQEQDLSPEEYYQRAKLGLRNASFTSTQKNELDLVPRATVPVSRSALEQSDPYFAQNSVAGSISGNNSQRDIVSVSAPALEEMSRTESQQRQTRFADGNLTPTGEKSNNRSSASLRDNHQSSGKGKAAVAGLAGAGTGAYAAHRLDGDDRGYAAASGFQQPQYAPPQNNFMQSQPQSQQNLGYGQVQGQYPQQQGQQGLVNATPVGVGLGDLNGQINAPRGAAPPVATYGNLAPNNQDQPQIFRNESRRSNIFDNMSGVPGKLLTCRV